MKLRGLVYIKHLLPLSKFSMFLKGVECPTILIDTSKDIVLALMKIGDAPSGVPHTPSIAQMKFLKQSLLGANGNTYSPEKDPGNPTGVHTSGPLSSNASKPSVNVLAEELAAFKKQQEENRSFDPTLGNKFLDQMVGKGAWTNLDASIEDLLLHSAFLVCPHSLPDGTSTEMGHYSFKCFVDALQRLPSDDAKREATRSRFRASLIMTTPYALRLKADGKTSLTQC